MSSVFDKLHRTVHGIGSDLKDKLSGNNEQGQPQQQGYNAQQQGQPQSQPGQEYHNDHRFLSFAPERHGNDIKWYVDGVSYDSTRATRT
jgi:phospholipase D1/2